MSEHYGKGESIECNGAYVVSKKIEPSCPLNHPTLGKCIKYVCTRDGRAQITEELNPKESKIPKSISKLNLGDLIDCHSFYVLVEGFKPKKINFAGKFSGAHNANNFNTSSEYTYAEISKPYPAGEKLQITFPDGFISPLEQLKKRLQ